MTHSPYGLFLLSNPCLVNNSEIRFRDSCYVDTILQTQSMTSRSLIIARTRLHETNFEKYSCLGDANAEMALSLPDYGSGGLQGLFQIFYIFANPSIRRTLSSLVKHADFIFVEGGTSIEAFLTAKLARRNGRRLILELRGSTVLNKDYMRQRFGMLGLLLVYLHHVILSYVRRQSLAGLYINKELMQDFPVLGDLKTAISDAYLPADFGGSPRYFTAPANHYLYVGHLEAVKRVDLIINALHLARELLPVDWHFDIVGSGPLEEKLRCLIVRLRLEKHVTFHGQVQKGERLASLYRRADVLLIASTTESGPRTLIEAMAFGLPVISTRVGIAPELLDELSLVPVGNTAKFADRLATLVNDTIFLTTCSKRHWQLSRDYKRNVLEAKRREFWEQAIKISRNGS